VNRKAAATVAARPGRRAGRACGSWLAVIGAAALVVSVGAYLGYALTHPSFDWRDPVDAGVYRQAGFLARGLPGLAGLSGLHGPAPLYHWGGRQLQFTYTPFAALAFTVLTLPSSFTVLWEIAAIADVVLLVTTIWVTLGGLGHRRSAARVGATLLLAAIAFWTEPVQRTLFLGQIEIVLMALIMWDFCQPDRRWWKGAGIGLAAGIKLVPLIFIPYLLLTRRLRQAAVASAVFAATVAVGFLVLPADSRDWWLGGLFLRGGRTGFVGWEGNQSLLGIITRLAGSQAAAQPGWLAAAAVTGVAGLAAAAALDRRGQPVAGLLTVALTGLLVSPISWDHHWVWVVPIAVVLADRAARATGTARWAWAALAAAVTAAFAAWPASWWGEANAVGRFGEGLIWMPPNTSPGTYFRLGDRPWYVEYHWHGSQLISGNLFVLAGMALFVLTLVLAGQSARTGRPGSRAAVRAPAPD